MDSYFQGTDIHEFLACLGRNAIANVTFGFSDLQTLEPDVHNLVFVEDVEPSLADLGSIDTEGGKKGWNENQEVAAPFLTGSGAGKGGAPSDNGWDAEGDNVPCDDGWGMPDTQENGVTPHDGGGWNTPKEDIPAASGWGTVQNSSNKNTQNASNNKNARKASMPLSNDWGMADDAPLEGGWGAKQTAATGSDYEWDSVVKNGGHKTAPAHPHRKTADMTDPTDNHHVSERRSGVFGPSGSNIVPLGKRRVAMKKVCDPTDGLHFDQFKSDSPSMKTTMQCVEEGDQTAWENCKQFGDKGLGDETVSGNGWGSTQEEALSDNGWGAVKTTPCDDAWVMDDVAEHGATHENSVASHEDRKNAPKDTSMSGWGMGESTPQNTPMEEVKLSDSGWGIAEDASLESGWGVATNQQKMTTAGDDGWDAMEGQNARDGWNKAAYTHPSRKATNTTDLTEVDRAGERRSGMFGPSGSNMVQLGKRRNTVKADVNYSMKKGKQCEEKGDQTVWATREQQTTSVDDSGWESNTLEEGNINEQTGQKGLGHDEWATALELGTLAAGQTNQIPKDSLGGNDWKCAPEPEASNTNGWGSEVQMADNSQGNGWDDINSDAPSALCSMEQPQPGWGSKALDPSDTPPSTWLPRQDDMPRPRRRATQGSNGDSWVGFASNGPKTQSRRSRLRTLMASPEYAELDELQKFANQILHNKGYQNGDRLNPEDEKLVLEKVLVYHPDKEAKLGCGVDYLMIDAHSDHQVSCFFVVRKDGSKTDFSYWKCLEGMLETKYSQADKDEVPKEEAKDSWERGI